MKWRIGRVIVVAAISRNQNAVLNIRDGETKRRSGGRSGGAERRGGENPELAALAVDDVIRDLRPQFGAAVDRVLQLWYTLLLLPDTGCPR
jgi:hypothetical protein